MLTTAGVTSFSRGARVGTWPSGPTIGVPASEPKESVAARTATAKTATGRLLCIMLAHPFDCRSIIRPAPCRRQASIFPKAAVREPDRGLSDLLFFGCSAAGSAVGAMPADQTAIARLW